MQIAGQVHALLFSFEVIDKTTMRTLSAGGTLAGMSDHRTPTQVMGRLENAVT